MLCARNALLFVAAAKHKKQAKVASVCTGAPHAAQETQQSRQGNSGIVISSAPQGVVFAAACLPFVCAAAAAATGAAAVGGVASF